MELDTGSIVDRYTIEGRIGEGGMAVVYRARHNQLGTLHAIKVLTIPGKSIRQRLLQEGRVQALLRHPNIVTVTDVIDVEGQPGLVMELIEGMSLEGLIEKMPLTIAQVDALARGIIEGVGEAHRQELIHRDLKPGNVMVQVTPRGPIPKVTDFGLAKVLSADEFSGTKTRSGMAMGTPCYMAPEQIRDAKTVDRRADIWALGCILYELLTQRRAFDGPDMFAIFTAVTSGQYVKIRELVPDVPARMEAAIEGCLVIDKDKRFADCDALLASWTGRAAEGTDASENSLWNAALLKSSMAPSPAPSKVQGTWSGDNAEVTKSLHPEPNKPSKKTAKTLKNASKVPSADSLLPDDLSTREGGKRGGPKSMPRPIPAPTGVIAPPTADDQSAEVPKPSGAIGYVAVGVGMGGLLLVAAVVLLSVGVAGGVLASGSNVEAAPVEEPDEEPAPPREVKMPVIKAPEVKHTDAKPADTKPVETASKPVETKPADPVDTKVPDRTATPTRTTKIKIDPKPAVVETVAVAEKGTLVVNSRPWSNITLDGVSAQRTGGWRREVSAGKHTIELTTAEGQTTRQTVEVRPNADTVFCWDFSLGAPCPK